MIYQTEACMNTHFSHSEIYQLLDEITLKLKQDNSPEEYLIALKEAQKSLLILELLNLSRIDALN